MHSEETRQAILHRLAEGESLRAICRDDGMPSLSTVMRWCEAEESFRDQYVRARDAGVDAEFEALSDLQAEEPRVGPSGSIDAGWVAWKRLQVDTKKWELSKRAPKKYGDKLDLNHGGTVKFDRIEVVVVDPAG